MEWRNEHTDKIKKIGFKEEGYFKFDKTPKVLPVLVQRYRLEKNSRWICVYVYMYMYMYVYLYLCVFVYVYAHVYVYVCIYVYDSQRAACSRAALPTWKTQSMNTCMYM